MKGTLIIVGGGLRKSCDEVFSALIEKAGGKNSKIAFIMTATGEDPDELFSSYQDDMEKLGLPRENCVQVPVYSPRVRDSQGRNFLTGDASRLCDYLNGVTGVWFSGGNQYFTTQAFLRKDGSDTAFLSRLREIYENGGVLAGSSAGAAIMSRVMIGGGNNRGILKNPVIFGYQNYDPDTEDPADPLLLDQGLGFFTDGIVDQHFNRRPRFLRLIEACMTNQEHVKTGFGISEDTALMYHEGQIQILGSAGLYIVRCEKAEKTGNGCYRNMLFHVLHKGDGYDTKTGRVFFSRPVPLADEKHDHDFLHSALPNDPRFDDLLAETLLCSEKESLDKFENGNSFGVRGCVPYKINGKTYLVMPEYLLTPDTTGCADETASVSHIKLNILSTEISL